jgi:serine/threonine protein phosphatase PrpC
LSYIYTAAAGSHVWSPAADRFLLCSDGVHDVVPTPQLASALQATTPHAALRDIHQMALRNRADDNLSIGIVDILRPRPAQSEPVAERRTRDHIEVPS